MKISIQRQRFLWRTGFFILFIFAPVLDIFRFDLNEGHFVLFGHALVFGIDASKNPVEILRNMFIYFFLPVVSIVSAGIFISWKWGRLYCGWLCPHFSVVEIINGSLRRTIGKLSLWDKTELPSQQMDGKNIQANKAWWPITGAVVVFFSFLWAVILITYLLPPLEIYSNLYHFTLTQYQFNFIVIATAVLSIEFLFARHLFCRFGCAVGLFQSLVWMGNKKAMVVGFDRKRANLCSSCDASCEHACPMRLKPRSLKRNMFTCTQCMQCIDACEKVKIQQTTVPLLKMLQNDCALDVSGRGLGYKPKIAVKCFEQEKD